LAALPLVVNTNWCNLYNFLSQQPFNLLYPNVPIQESGTPNPILQNTDIQLEEKLNYQNLN
jgi:hypothetical protein